MAPRGRGRPYSKGGKDGKGKAGKDYSEKDNGKNKSKGNDKGIQPLADKGKSNGNDKGNDKGKHFAQPQADKGKGKGNDKGSDKGKHFAQPLAGNGKDEFPTVKFFLGWSSIYDFPDHKRGRAAGMVGKLFALLDEFVDATTDDQERMGAEEAARNALIQKIDEVEVERVRLQQQLSELWEEELHAGSGSSSSSSSYFNNNNNNNSDIATSSDTTEGSKVTQEEFTLLLHDAQQALAARRSMAESQADAINAASGAEQDNNEHECSL